MIKKNKALNFTRPTNDPVISAGVIIANIIWNAIYTKCGILSAYVHDGAIVKHISDVDQTTVEDRL